MEASLKPTPVRGARASRLITAMLKPFWRLRRGMTLGAQGVIIDGGGRVLLVRHSYRPGWFFPGGGVEWGETIEAALARELDEEVGVELRAPAELHGIFSNFANFKGDHIAVFIVRHWTRRENYRRPAEISEADMFDVRHLPERTDAGTRNRLAEIFDGAPTSALW
jgi:ADP-ribose pyrophosphatase YjhB (NUDIX family)